MKYQTQQLFDNVKAISKSIKKKMKTNKICIMIKLVKSDSLATQIMKLLSGKNFSQILIW